MGEGVMLAAATNPEQVVLRDGSVIAMRSLETGDVASIAAWFDGLGEQTRYARFLSPLKHLDPRTLRDLAEVDHDRHEAIAAVTHDGKVVGIARYIREDAPRTAEVAIAVADYWSGRGIATRLLERIAARARESGVEVFVALCLSTNATIIRLLSRLGPTTIGSAQEGVVELRIDLRG